MKTCPVLYEDTPMVLLPGDEHNPPLLVHGTENVTFERMDDGSRLVKITLPPGREWVMLPQSFFSAEILDG